MRTKLFSVQAGFARSPRQYGGISQLLTPQTGNDCQACGAWFANRGNRGKVAGLAGQVRAGEDVNGGKREEMINDNAFSIRNPRDGEQTKSTQGLFHLSRLGKT